MANQPNRKEIIIPIISRLPITEISTFRKKEPNINGIAIKNENRTESFWFTPKINKVEIVIPDLDIPGNRAKIWSKPAIRTILKVKFFESLKYRVKNKNIPDTIKV